VFWLACSKSFIRFSLLSHFSSIMVSDCIVGLEISIVDMYSAVQHLLHVLIVRTSFSTFIAIVCSFIGLYITIIIFLIKFLNFFSYHFQIVKAFSAIRQHERICCYDFGLLSSSVLWHSVDCITDKITIIEWIKPRFQKIPKGFLCSLFICSICWLVARTICIQASQLYLVRKISLLTFKPLKFFFARLYSSYGYAPKEIALL